MTMPPMPEELTAAEAAELLGVTSQTIRVWIASGRLRARKNLTGHLRIPRTEIARLRGETPDTSAQPAAQPTAPPRGRSGHERILDDLRASRDVRMLELARRVAAEQYTRNHLWVEHEAAVGRRAASSADEQRLRARTVQESAERWLAACARLNELRGASSLTPTGPVIRPAARRDSSVTPDR